jgi:hypothetical protein
MVDQAPVQLPVEAVHIMMFARSIGDDNPSYVDIAHANELVAPPTFTEALQHFIPAYEFRPHPNRPWIGSCPPESANASPRVRSNTLHAEQHFEYHAVVRPGDLLTATIRHGKTWQKSGRSGTMRFFERITEFRNQRGELTVVSRLVGVTIEPTVPDSRDP